MNDLIIESLIAGIEDQKILNGVNLEAKGGEITALMGLNGSGKSTLAYVVMGHPKYKVKSGEVTFNKKNILGLAPDERSKLGIFLSFQYPAEISGVTVANFLRTALNAHRNNPISVMQFRKLLKEKLEMLKMDQSFAERYLNDGFSGGEKKRAEILQLAVLQPKFAILDETDSGLDIDALKIVAEGVKSIKKENPEMGILIITHYQRILNYIKPDKLHVMIDGRIAKSGSHDLAHKLESEGYDWIIRESKLSSFNIID